MGTDCSFITIPTREKIYCDRQYNIRNEYTEYETDLYEEVVYNKDTTVKIVKKTIIDSISFYKKNKELTSDINIDLLETVIKELSEFNDNQILRFIPDTVNTDEDSYSKEENKLWELFLSLTKRKMEYTPVMEQQKFDYISKYKKNYLIEVNDNEVERINDYLGNNKTTLGEVISFDSNLSVKNLTDGLNEVYKQKKKNK